MPLQLDDMKLWKGKTLQQFSIDPPSPTQTRLAMYLVRIHRSMTIAEYKEFTSVKETLTALVSRDIKDVAFGMIDNSGGGFKVIIRWEKSCAKEAWEKRAKEGGPGIAAKT